MKRYQVLFFCLILNIIWSDNNAETPKSLEKIGIKIPALTEQEEVLKLVKDSTNQWNEIKKALIKYANNLSEKYFLEGRIINFDMSLFSTLQETLSKMLKKTTVQNKIYNLTNNILNDINMFMAPIPAGQRYSIKPVSTTSKDQVLSPPFNNMLYLSEIISRIVRNPHFSSSRQQEIKENIENTFSNIPVFNLKPDKSLFKFLGFSQDINFRTEEGPTLSEVQGRIMKKLDELKTSKQYSIQELSLLKKDLASLFGLKGRYNLFKEFLGTLEKPSPGRVIYSIGKQPTSSELFGGNTILEYLKEEQSADVSAIRNAINSLQKQLPGK